MELVGLKQVTSWSHKTLLTPKPQLFLGWNMLKSPQRHKAEEMMTHIVGCRWQGNRENTANHISALTGLWGDPELAAGFAPLPLRAWVFSCQEGWRKPKFPFLLSQALLRNLLFFPE